MSKDLKTLLAWAVCVLVLVTGFVWHFPRAFVTHGGTPSYQTSADNAYSESREKKQAALENKTTGDTAVVIDTPLLGGYGGPFSGARRGR